RTPGMKYVAMIYGSQAKWDAIPAEAWPEAIARQKAFNTKYRQSGELLGAYGLADAAAAQLVRRGEGVPVVTEGPYLETKEYIASFCLLDCHSLQRAQAIAADMPIADTEPVELWPILHESPTQA
ncbi:YciI family protein, partial [Streptomyces sp. NPDC056503]|uniref:YciI family protein n=1 Tax=Streptomyces sp. NPDC056503 TaxID=3345842 RepID=UPI0036A7DF1A